MYLIVVVFVIFLYQQLTHPDPCERPSAADILGHPLLNPLERRTKRQLCNELNLERQKNELLMQKLRQMEAMVKSYELQK